MNNDIRDIIGLLLRNKWVRIALVVIPLIILTVALVIFIQRPPKVTAYNTSLRATSTQLVDGKLATYNGTSFYTVDPTSGSVRTLYTPTTRLPDVSTILWAGERGVLLNFSSGVIYTPIQDYFTTHGISLITDNYYTWYLDFKDGSLHMVDEFNLSNGTASYSVSDDGFYYVPDIKYSDTEAGKSALRFYNIKTHESETIIDDFNVIVSSMKPCSSASTTICIVGRGIEDTYEKNTIYTVSRTNKKLEKLYQHEGEVYPTPLDNTYLLLSAPEEYQEVDIIYKKLTTLNIQTKEKTEYSGTVFGGLIVVGTDNDGAPIVFDGKNSEYSALVKGLFSNGTKVTTVSLPKGSALQDGFALLANQSNTDNTMVTSLTGEAYLLSTKDMSKLPVRESSSTLQSGVDTCIKPSGSTLTLEEDTLTIYVPDDEHFADNIREIKSCIAKDTKMLYGYTYDYKGVSPYNGRISTD